MKKILLLITLLAPLLLYAQAGSIIHTVAGTSISGYSGDGGAATSATLFQSKGVCIDGAGNMYFSDIGNHVVRRVDAVTGIITTIAGVAGSPGFAGDGGPAVLAQFYVPYGLCVDASGNLYIVDADNRRIRKINFSTGIITTVAGGSGTATAIGDGGPATSAYLAGPDNVYVDAANNIFITEASARRVRKVDGTTGIITTFAGTGIPGYTGDGGPATAAQLLDASQMGMDSHGNLYIAAGNTVRKVDAATGIISTYAGNGGTVSATVIDSVPATAATFNNIYGLAVDSHDNVVISDHYHGLIRRVDAITGIIKSIAGGGTSLADNIPALNASINVPEYLCTDVLGNVYITNGNSIIRKIIYNYPGMVAAATGGFTTYIDKQCSGPAAFMQTSTFAADLTVKTYWGDGSTNSSPIFFGFGGGYANVDHEYANSGTYFIKQVLYSGVSPVDSTHFLYEYSYCKTLTGKLYVDVDNNCTKGNAEPYVLLPVSIEIDSNGTSVDTISATSGFYYSAHGSPGDIYSMKIIHTVPGIIVTCPVSGTLYDTLRSSFYSVPSQYFGFNCSATAGFNLGIRATSLSAPTRHSGDILVWNVNCTPELATVTVANEGKYIYESSGLTPVSTAGDMITWEVGGLSSVFPTPVHIHYTMDKPSSVTGYIVGDSIKTQYAIGPATGDADPSDNSCSHTDKIRSSLDPNYIEANPGPCITSAATDLEYTIGFENTGNDTAYNIYVLDTIPNTLDIDRIEVIGAAATMNISKIKNSSYNIMKFDFPGIMLPDSSHHNLCHGIFMYKIKTLAGLADGTVISNKAGIYFDANPVVMTNTSNVTVNCPPLGITAANNGNDEILLYPNPATDELTITTKPGDFAVFTISNTMGEQLVTQRMIGGVSKVNINILPQGVYYIALSGSRGSELRKFIKW